MKILGDKLNDYPAGVQLTWPKKPLEKPPENQLEISYTGKSFKKGSLDMS